MIGIKLDELIELVSYNHEAKFEYDGKTYVLQPEVDEDGNAFWVIWDCSPDGICICKHRIPQDGDIPQECIDTVLSEKCFNGKSFLEIEKDITVTVIH